MLNGSEYHTGPAVKHTTTRVTVFQHVFTTLFVHICGLVVRGLRERRLFDSPPCRSFFPCKSDEFGLLTLDDSVKF